MLVDGQREENFGILERLVDSHLGPEWRSLVMALRENQSYEGVTYLGLRDAPAAKGNHHAYKGGLVQHLLEMWDFYYDLPAFPITSDPFITPTRVLQGILLHDLHKAWCTFIEDPDSPSGLNYGKHPSDSLLTQDQKTIYIVQQAGIKLDLIQMNALFCSEGGWAKSPPKWCSSLAKLLYLLDEWSGNIYARVIQGNSVDLRRTSFLPPDGLEFELPV